jgi:putative transposase
MLNPELRERLWPFLGGIAKQNGITPRCIGGVADHVHLLLSLPTTVPNAKAIQLIKAGSSAWIDQTFRQLDNFSCQQGDGAFSVSVSQLPETNSFHPKIRSNIIGPELFHRDLAFLRRHEHSTRCRLLMPGLSFDDKYLWD